MKKTLTFFLLVFASTILLSQNDDRIAKTKTPLSDIPQIKMPAQDNEALLSAEMQRRGPGIAPRFAINIEVDISPKTHGTWETLANGKAVWRLRIFSEGAKSLNLGFTKYVMPRGGSLILYSPDYERVIGPFTPADNEGHEQLWTPVLEGEELVIEVQVPAGNKDLLALQLKYVNHDFMGFSQVVSGSCNLDVICGGADGWEIVDAYRDIIQSVAVISTGGGTFCTGFLVNNARQDCTPYFMTANHCGINNGNAPSLVTFWNFENSTCRQPNSPQSGVAGDGSMNDFNTGAIFRAGWGDSDFTLVELDDPVSETADAFFAGWSAEDFAPQDTVIGIHHPSTDEKRISFEFEPTYIGDYFGYDPNPNGNHIAIPDWDVGTTEGGSSGSPLFNNQKRVVGQLHGGGAACGNDQSDFYGWFHTSWEGGGTPTTRLKDWLDPDGTGIIVLDGRSQLQCSFFVAAAPSIVEICTPDEVEFEVIASENFEADVNLSVSNLPGGLTATFAQNPIAPGDTTTLTIGNTASIGPGTYNFSVDGTDGTNSNFSQLVLTTFGAVPQAANLIAPSDGATGTTTLPDFVWDNETGATYTLQVATDPAFADLVFTETGIAAGQLQSPLALMTTQQYYWRVVGSNVCGEGVMSPVFSFTTAAIFCAPLAAADLPIAISSVGTAAITSTIEVASGGLVDDLNVNNIEIAHTWVGDLRIELTSPSGTTIALLSNPSGGDCQEDDLLLNFDDAAANTYADLNAMCDGVPPAIMGTFQPFQALSGFAGEPVQGTWTLTVYDDVNEDGGSLDNWALEICSTIPNDFSVNPSAIALENCLADSASFTLFTGTAFDATSGVSLSANNLPAGATATFEPNPAAPGSEVNVTISGATETGVFDLEIVADDGANTGTAQVALMLQDVPSPPVANFPTPGGGGISLTPVFDWSASQNANYLLQVATDAGMDSVIFEGTSPEASLSLNDALEFCTQYYWQVSAENGCGSSGFGEVFSFTTEGDLTFAVSPSSLVSCNFGEAEIMLAIGECLDDAGVQLTAEGLPAGASVEFSANPAPAGAQVGVLINLNDVAPGAYTITIAGEDGANSVTETFDLQVEGSAAATSMFEPADGATDVSIEPTFVWEPGTGITNYQFELATDDNFTNIVFETIQAQATLVQPALLEGETLYFWRVTSFNECGGTTPAAFSFTTEITNAAHEVNGSSIEISPNPTGGLLQVKTSGTLQEAIDLTVYSINGIRLLESQLPVGKTDMVLDLSAFPSGIYLLKMKSGKSVQAERIILR
ncbi:MAG TPA: T9SS type A sorting domain-containing protein [Bacteroidetes bacterium]|nr:T9SS type A sorting domain-containing protein [Bacteroidota bacterium]